ncbi:unnamed protein product [Cladocopium goreaui]|uniref:Uncharacterized protein n=1 Tax=Cladocopium goreaui TaxID=2562237 RepID=A0A9P1CYA8_9DINO|nr:unnamed protein product [Cladocopium goreaui]
MAPRKSKSKAPSVAGSQASGSDMPASGCEFNAELLHVFRKHVNDLHDLWPDVTMEDPLLVKDGGKEAPFNSSHYTSVMNSTETGKKVYRCGQNWFRHNLFWSPTSGVPRLHSLCFCRNKFLQRNIAKLVDWEILEPRKTEGKHFE